MTDAIKLSKDGPVWRITLNRPDKANALTSAMLNTLVDHLIEAQADPNIRVLHLTGTGSRVFCAGADLDEIGTNAGETYFRLWETVAETLAACPFLTIAALNGATMGGGLVLAMACDIRLAVPHARFAYPILKNGITPDKAQTNRLRGLIGPARTSLLILGSAKIEAETALNWGLIEEICDDPLEQAELYSTSAANADHAHLARLKSLIQTGRLPET